MHHKPIVRDSAADCECGLRAASRELRISEVSREALSKLPSYPYEARNRESSCVATQGRLLALLGLLVLELELAVAGRPMGLSARERIALVDFSVADAPSLWGIITVNWGSGAGRWYLSVASCLLPLAACRFLP